MARVSCHRWGGAESAPAAAGSDAEGVPLFVGLRAKCLLVSMSHFPEVLRAEARHNLARLQGRASTLGTASQKVADPRFEPGCKVETGLQ